MDYPYAHSQLSTWPVLCRFIIRFTVRNMVRVWISFRVRVSSRSNVRVTNNG